MQNFEKNKKKTKNKDLATSPDIRVVVETLFFFLVRSSRKEEVASQSANLRRTISTAKTTILQFGLDDCAVRVGGFCSSG